MHIYVFQWSFRVSLSWTIKRVWKFVYYRLHVLLCILHNAIHHFIRENVGFFNKDRFFTDLAASRGPGAYFCTDSQLLFYEFVCLYLFIIHFLSFSWSQYIRNYAQLVVVHYHKYYHLEYDQDFWIFVSVEFLQNFWFISCFFFHRIFSIDMFFFNFFNFLFYLSHNSFIFCLIVVILTLQSILIIYIIFIYDSISKKRLFTFI